MDCSVDCCIDCHAMGDLIQIWIEITFELTLRLTVQIVRSGPVIIVAGACAYTYYKLTHPKILGVATVISGNTIEIKGKRIRIFGIVAPKRGQEVCIPPDKCEDGFDYSKKKLKGHVDRKKVKCIVTEPNGKWGRVEGRCYLKGEDIGRWMVKNGYAFADLAYSQKYNNDEDRARRKKLGFHGAIDPPTNPRNWANQKEREIRVEEYLRRRLPGNPAMKTLFDLRADVDVKIDGGFLVTPDGNVELG